MVLKKLSEQAAKKSKDGKAAKLANELAGRPYGVSIGQDQAIVRTSISLPQALLEKAEDVARENKRMAIEPRNVSALVRNALEAYLINMK